MSRSKLDMLAKVTELVLQEELVREERKVAQLEAEEQGLGRVYPFTISANAQGTLYDFVNNRPNHRLSTLNLNNDGPGDVNVRHNTDHNPDNHVLKSGESEEISYGGSNVIEDLFVQLNSGSTASVRVRVTW